MSLALFIQGLGSIGLFASRAFLPAFATALALRFGPEIGWIAHAGLFPLIRGVPTGFTSDTSLIVLGVLSALELVAERSPEFHAIFAGWVHGLRGLMAALTYAGVLKAADVAVLDPMLRQAGFLDTLPALVVGVATFATSQFQSLTLDFAFSFDEEDPFGFRRLLRRLGDAWGLLGPFGLLLFPLATLLLVAVATAFIGWLARRAAVRDERAKVGCAGCGLPIHACALSCFRCGTAVAEPRGVTWIGATGSRPAPDRVGQPFRLVAVGRCPKCANRIGRARNCRECGHVPFADPGFTQDYLRFIDRRVPVACGTGLIFGLVPVLGGVAGVIVYRLMLVGPFKRYSSTTQGFWARWKIRLVCFVLFACQIIPLLGALTLPAMALMNHAAYRKAFAKSNPPAKPGRVPEV